MSEVELTLQDFIDSGWESLIAKAEKRECSVYGKLLGEKARELIESGGNPAYREVYKILSWIFSLYWSLDNPDQPFRPASAWSYSRNMMLEDITDEKFSVLLDLAPTISDAEAKARICDIIWVGKRNHLIATTAVNSYLATATILEDPNTWSYCTERIERAMSISLYLGRHNQPLKNVISHIEDVLDKYNGSDPLFLSCKLMELLLNLKAGDPDKYSLLAKNIAITAETQCRWDKARLCWTIMGKWAKLGSDKAGQRDSLICAAETYVKEALIRTTGENQSFMIAAGNVQSAIEALRRIGGQQSKIDELHKLLLDYQEKSVSELKPISIPFDPTEEQERSRNSVKGKSLADALLALALMENPKKDYIRSQVLNDAKQFPLHHFLAAVAVNEKGKVVHRKPGMMSDDPQEQEAAIKAEMIQRVNRHQQYCVITVIDPARTQILYEHYVRESDFLDLVQNSIFVPDGRERMFARGLYAGFTGDILVSSHLLIPQIENSIRYILGQHDVITSYLNSYGIQDEKDINDLLYMDELKGILGEDMLFDLQCILVERVGANMRNRLAHGLLDDESFLTLQAQYLWWIVLKMCCVGYLSVIEYQRKQLKDKDTGEVPSKDDEVSGDMPH